MSVVLQLSCIKKISGNITLLTVGQPQKPQGWHVSDLQDGFRILNEILCLMTLPLNLHEADF